MLSKNKQKLVRSLDRKKNRDAEGLFLAEGPKLVTELLAHFRCRLLVGEPAVLSKVPSEANAVAERVEVTAEELARVSLQRAPQGLLAVFEKPQPVAAQSLLPVAGRSLCLALDGVQDPGNVGTIVRIADWWGIEHVICSHDTADVFAPKTVQSTMGALGRVGVHYTDLPAWLDELPAGTPVYGTLLEGDNLYDSELTPHGIIVMGNEGNGLSSAVRERVSHRLLIPSFPPDRPTSESLNVAVATAVTCAEFRRRS
jgi:hypothetical protein BACCOPRO_01172